MTTTIYPNGIKVHCVWQDGTHMKEGEKIPLEVQKKSCSIGFEDDEGGTKMKITIKSNTRRISKIAPSYCE